MILIFNHFKNLFFILSIIFYLFIFINSQIPYPKNKEKIYILKKIYLFYKKNKINI